MIRCYYSVGESRRAGQLVQLILTYVVVCLIVILTGLSEGFHKVPAALTLHVQTELPRVLQILGRYLGQCGTPLLHCEAVPNPTK